MADQVDEGDWGEASCFLHISDTCLKFGKLLTSGDFDQIDDHLEMLLPVLQMAIGQQFLK